MASESEALHGHLAHARGRRAAARELCRRARQRVLSARRCVIDSRVRLEGRAAQGDGGVLDGVVALRQERGRCSTATTENELAPLLDFVARRSARAEGDDEDLDRTRAESLLGQILWDFGAEHARPLVEAALTLLGPDEARDSAQPEIAALRSWLARNPSPS